MRTRKWKFGSGRAAAAGRWGALLSRPLPPRPDAVTPPTELACSWQATPPARRRCTPPLHAVAARRPPRSARCRAAPPPRAAAAPQPRCCRAAAVPPRRRAAVAPACVRGGLPGCHAPAVHNALPATRCMCPPRPPQHVPPWLPQHMSAMDDTARATPGCPQARCHRHTATTHGGRGECPHCGASATAACLLHVLVALWVGLPWLPPSTMAATARPHQGCHGTPPPIHGRYSTRPPTSIMLPCDGCQPHGAMCPAQTWEARCGCCNTPPMGPPWPPHHTLPWPPQHTPAMAATALARLPWAAPTTARVHDTAPPPCRHGRHNTRQHSCWPCCPMGATARPHHGCHSTPPPWAPQHTPSEMAAWPWPATAPTCPLAQWPTVGRLLAPWAHWWGPHALGGCFAFFLHFAGCS